MIKKKTKPEPEQRQVQLPFAVAVQTIERVIISGEPEHIGAAVDWCQSLGFILSQVGPRLLGRELAQTKDQRFILLAERAIKQAVQEERGE